MKAQPITNSNRNQLKEFATRMLTDKFGGYVSDEAIADFVNGNDMADFIGYNEQLGVEFLSELSICDTFEEYNSHLLEDGGYWNEEE